MRTKRVVVKSTPHEQLNQLLSERDQHPHRAAEIDAEIRRIFERKVAILVLDMCGFSRLTAKHGIIHFLAMIHQMQEGACPAVLANDGQVVKMEADNIFAVFERPEHALEAALDIFRTFEAMNAVVPEERDIHGSIGIGYGDTLLIGDGDMFGVEMNYACKLGEDLACKSEILLTPAAHDALPGNRYQFSPASYHVSGLDIKCHRFENRVLVKRPAKAKAKAKAKKK